MRKIYALVLLAAALLVGTNVWATVWTNLVDAEHKTGTEDASLTVGETTMYGSINDVFNAIETGETATIKLLQSPVTPTGPIGIYSNLDGTGAPKEITLDMNGGKITYSGYNAGKQLKCLFYILKGHLTIKNTSDTKATIETTYTGSQATGNAAVTFLLTGSAEKTDANYSNLTVEQGVEIRGRYAGVQVDYAANWNNANTLLGITYAAPVPTNCAYGVNVVVNDSIVADQYGMQVLGNVKASPKTNGGTKDDYTYPNLVVGANAKIKVSDVPVSWMSDYNKPAGQKKQPIGIYSSGYSIWTVSGSVEGANGILLKMGVLTVNEQAHITATAPTTNVNTASGSNQSGARGSGNAISMVTDWNNGTMEVTITGDPVIETETPGGTAIIDAPTGNKPDQVTNVTIEGGTFNGDVDGAAVTISDSFTGSLDVTGGTYQGNIETLINTVGENNVITDVVADDGAGHATVVINKPAATDVVVAPTTHDYMPDHTVLDNATENSVIKLVGDSAPSAINLTFENAKVVAKYLSLNGSAAKPVTVTIGATQTMEVGQIVMNAHSQIVVEAGGKLFVNGKNGVFADEVDNLILKADANHTALFVMSPTVKTNKQPKATVYIYTNACQPNATTWQWQRISIPLSTFESRTPIYTGPYTTGSSLNTWLEEWSSESGTWELVSGGWSGMRAFKGYALTNNTTAGGAIYAVKGNMQGVVDGSIQFDQAGWNFFGNSYTAPIHLRTLLDSIWTSAPEADGTIWYFNSGNQTYTYENKLKFDLGINDHVEITPLESFVIRLNEGNSAVAKAGYATSVWDYNTMTPAEFNTAHPAAAPQRVNGQTNVVRINLTATNGTSDNVILVEGENYTADYENSADAYKVMNAGMNIYAAADDNYAMVATDDILGTMISLNTNEEINYTLSFSNVRGEVYALRDNETNRVVLMNEGAIYNFTAQPNATLDGRFQIVSRQEMPTAVETIEETVAPKAIYTIMGQYVGETTDWNNLPAGVYVIDGVKVIK